MKQPFEIIDISNKLSLYGRDTLLRKLIILAKRCENASIIGARRFGKTCLLKSIITEIRDSKNIKVYPIYLDFKTEDIKGTDAAYRYMISSLVVSLNNDKIFTSEEDFGLIKISPSDDWTEVDEQLLSLSSVRLQTCLKKIVTFFAAFMEKTILFVIDEYEYLFKYVLDSPASFMKLRDLSTSVIENDLRPFIFWISGALNWDHLCSVIGSGECNPISATEYVTPISKEDFVKMWNDECELIEDEAYRKKVLAEAEFAWKKSGGVPFYGKLIGAYLVRNNSLPDHTICKPFFNEMLNKTLSVAEINTLKILVKGLGTASTSLGYSSLCDKGIIVNEKNKTILPIEFLKEYIMAAIADSNLSKPKKAEHESIVFEISQIIENINKTQENKRRSYIFKPTVDSMSTFKDLTGPCFSTELFAEFSCAIYRIYFEWTKDTKPRELLPNNNFRYNDFAQYVDIARHSLGKTHQMDTFELSDGKKSKPDMILALLGTVNEPKDPDEFYKLQMAFLRMFKTTLLEIQNYVRKN